ncbi:MAG: SDR family NAD(P)-dependent oxidoreductase [Thermoplasmata archaeon]
MSAPDELIGQVAVVTGGTSGLGRAIALGLAHRGATTVVVGRGTERAATAAREIAEAAHSRRVDSVGVSDLALKSDQRALCDELLRRYPKIHLLVNNAGAIFFRRDVTPEGLERTFALNVLAPFVLTERLAPSLRSSGSGRVVNIASAAHRGRRLDLSDLQGERHYSGWGAYGRSKLASILLTREFARRFGSAGPTVNAVHPGFVRTRFAQNNGGLFAGAVRFAGWVAGRSVAQGADTALFVAADPSAAGVSGRYFSDRRVVSGSVASQDPGAARALFDACELLARAG